MLERVKREKESAERGTLQCLQCASPVTEKRDTGDDRSRHAQVGIETTAGAPRTTGPCLIRHNHRGGSARRWAGLPAALPLSPPRTSRTTQPRGAPDGKLGDASAVGTWLNILFVLKPNYNLWFTRAQLWSDTGISLPARQPGTRNLWSLDSYPLEY